MTKTAFLFVYGSLMRRSPHPMARRLRRGAVYCGPATAPGQLYDLGCYPGMALTQSECRRVHGDLYRLSAPEAAFLWLDRYEMCSPADPEPHLYRRVAAPARFAAGREALAWIYVLIAVPRAARRIHSGRYFQK